MKDPPNDAGTIQVLLLADARSAQALIGRNPKFQSLVGQLLALYGEITKKGLENEQKG